MPLSLQFVVDDVRQEVPLVGDKIRFGRGSDNDVVLPDFSVSRRHALLRREGPKWVILDLGSTNGVEVNGTRVEEAELSAGDRLTIGVFEISVKGDETGSRMAESIPNATIVRKLSDFSAGGFGAEVSQAILCPPEEVAVADETAPGEVGTRRYFDFLNRLARDLIHAYTAEEVLRRVIDIAFAALPIDRCFILVGDTIDDVECRLSRIGEEVQIRPAGEMPISSTILRTVMEEQVALLTLDALDDQRLQGGESIRIHGIRAAMCAPLWSEDRITGFIQVDSPFQAGSFTGRHLDFLITLANYAAVGVQRVEERKLRGRLERYHSPAVLDAVLREEDLGAGQGLRALRKKDVTVLFGDLTGFTAFAESASLDEVADLLTGFCSRCVGAIFDQGGTLDKFIGDCVMAFFGAPMDQADHAVRGVRAALSIQSAVEEWNVERRERGQPDVRCRIALNSGPAVVGDVGSNQRVDYTVLGNAVNVAARLESSVAAPGQIVIGEPTRELIGDLFELEPLGEFALKNLQRRVAAHRVLGEREPSRALDSQPAAQSSAS